MKYIQRIAVIVTILCALIIISMPTATTASTERKAEVSNGVNMSHNLVGYKFKGVDGCDMVMYIHTDPTTKKESAFVEHSNICKQCFRFD